ncbi:TPA: hypothetical protein ACH85X_002883 [Legionella pneumophila]|uniref:hypothetical protein n=1 Tax=Legionella pneumophila TaxID=446 RepID=UPI000AB4E008|nr:hypothetical protein [Legionella pneumophila]HAT1740820.1 hypothetical protein [Legionella pneumophila]HAT1746480.1 hypothetical protein [Legionella pneumophila]HAT1755430.1 hypothetical protein [Legionella pneumophila]HAT1819370.1 hypothetical protein [Legionella pneumophila]HAT4423274.1 hypothetical protein [Legionella pneumophila]
MRCKARNGGANQKLMIIVVQRFFSGLSPYCLNAKTHGNPTAAAADPWLIKK